MSDNNPENIKETQAGNPKKAIDNGISNEIFPLDTGTKFIALYDKHRAANPNIISLDESELFKFSNNLNLIALQPDNRFFYFFAVLFICLAIAGNFEFGLGSYFDKNIEQISTIFAQKDFLDKHRDLKFGYLGGIFIYIVFGVLVPSLYFRYKKSIIEKAGGLDVKAEEHLKSQHSFGFHFICIYFFLLYTIVLLNSYNPIDEQFIKQITKIWFIIPMLFIMLVFIIFLATIMLFILGSRKPKQVSPSEIAIDLLKLLDEIDKWDKLHPLGNREKIVF